MTSFDVMDEILRRLARRDAFPNLRAIVLSGHSAGGQFVSRYQMSNQVHETLGVPVTYVVAKGLAYARYVNERFGAKHEVRPVPSCGHNARCMFTDAAALALLFPRR